MTTFLSVISVIPVIPVISLLTATKDYVEIVHKVIQFSPSISDYQELGSFITYLVLSIKTLFVDLFTFNWLKNSWSLPVIVPDIASAIISEVSVLDGNFHNAFTFLETPFNLLNNNKETSPPGILNYTLYGLEKFSLGFFNSFFLFLPTGAAHIIFFRRLVFQGLKGGYTAGLGTIAGNVLWLSSIIFGWRFFVIPWLTFDILRYSLGFLILIYFMFHASQDKRKLSKSSKSTIFYVNFLLAFTEQTNLFPFITNISFGTESSILETFPALGNENLGEFFFIHSAYIIGILAGSLTLLNFICYLWKNPIARFAVWIKKEIYMPKLYTYTDRFFLYLIMLCTFSSFPYFGLDYKVANPVGLVADDRILEQRNAVTQRMLFPEISFLRTQAIDLNSRNDRGHHTRRERWKKQLIKYKGFDSLLYNKGTYDIFPIEDINFGFDKFWLRKGIRYKLEAFRALSLKDVLSGIRLDRHKAIIQDHISGRHWLFERLYIEFYNHPFHYKPTTPLLTQWKDSVFNNFKKADSSVKAADPGLDASEASGLAAPKEGSPYSAASGSSDRSLPRSRLWHGGEKRAPSSIININKPGEENTPSFSALRKFVRKVNTRVKSAEILKNQKKPFLNKSINSKQGSELARLPFLPEKVLMLPQYKDPGNLAGYTDSPLRVQSSKDYSQLSFNVPADIKREKLSKKDRQIFRYKTKLALYQNNQNNNASNQKELSSKKKESRFFFKHLTKTTKMLHAIKSLLYRKIVASKAAESKEGKKKLALSQKDLAQKSLEVNNASTMLHPIKFYLQREKAFRRKFQFYGPSVFRKFSVENNAPHFRVLMKRLFYFYKPTFRWRTIMHAAKQHQGAKSRTKKRRRPRKLDMGGVDFSSLSPLKNNGAESYDTHTSSLPLLSLPKGEGREARGLLRDPKVPGSYEPQRREGEGSSPSLINTKESSSLKKEEEENLFLLKKPTHQFAIKGKNPSRYRNLIFKHVLFHYFYDPFKRTLSKLDIDAFIRRQPKSHFLTKKDEQGLHLKRFLLADHYDTLRWYTYMQHYRVMKTKIGGTKSFASKFVYNQQFQGTLKKVRHLFAITPHIEEKSGSNEVRGEPLTQINTDRIAASPPQKKIKTYEKTILKFDQPLYNEYSNKGKNSLVNDSVMHEELSSFLPYRGRLWRGKDSLSTFPKVKDDLITQSTLIVKEYLKAAKPIREKKIKEYLFKKDYKELTKFMLKGQKLRGEKATTNFHRLMAQEKVFFPRESILPYDALSLPPRQGSEAAPLYERAASLGESSQMIDAQSRKSIKANIKQIMKGLIEEAKSRHRKYQGLRKEKEKKEKTINEKLWFSLLNHYRKSGYNLRLLKKVVLRRAEERINRNKKKETDLKKRLERLEKWLSPNFSLAILPFEGRSRFSPPPSLFPSLREGTGEQGNNLNNFLTTGLKSAIKESALSLESDSLLEGSLHSSAVPMTQPPLGSYDPERSESLVSGLFLKKAKTTEPLEASKMNKKSQSRFKKAATLPLFILKKLKGSFIRSKSLFKKVLFFKRYLVFHGKAQINKIRHLISNNPPILWFKPLARKDITKWEQKHRMQQNEIDHIKSYYPDMIKRNKMAKKEEEREERRDLRAYRRATKKSPRDLRSFLQKQKPVSEKPSNYEGTSSAASYNSRELDQEENLEYLGQKLSSIPPEADWEEESKKLRQRQEKREKTGLLSLGKEAAPDSQEQEHKSGQKPVLNNVLNNSRIKQTKGKWMAEFPNFKSITNSVRNFWQLSPERKAAIDQKIKRRNAIYKTYNIPYKPFSINGRFSRTTTNHQRRDQRFTQIQRLTEVMRPTFFPGGLDPTSPIMLEKKSIQDKDASLNQKSTNLFVPDLVDDFRQIPQKINTTGWRKYKSKINEQKILKAREDPITPTAKHRFGAISRKIKRIEFEFRSQQWWWQTFLPNFEANEEVMSQLEKERSLQLITAKLARFKKVLLDLDDVIQGIEGIKLLKESGESQENQLNRPRFFTKNTGLEIGNFDYRPLYIPQALQIRASLIKNRLLITDLIKKGAKERNEGSFSFFQNRKNTLNLKEGLLDSGIKKKGESMIFNHLKTLKELFGLERNQVEGSRLWLTGGVLPSDSSPIALSSREVSHSEERGNENSANEKGESFTNKVFLKAKNITNFISKLYKKMSTFRSSPGAASHTSGEGREVSQGREELRLDDNKSLLITNLYKKLFKISTPSSLASRRNAFEENSSPLLLKESPSDSQSEKAGSEAAPLKGPLTSLNMGKKLMMNTSALPFYAGWDESLRKFVVTNRLLSRREAGYSVIQKDKSFFRNSTNINTSENETLSDETDEREGAVRKIEFTEAPLQGMNAGTTLYWVAPFTTISPDQLFPRGLDGFAPVGWRRFRFNHTILKTKALLPWLKFRSQKKKTQSLSPLEQNSNKESGKEKKTGSIEERPLLIKKIILSPSFPLLFDSRLEGSEPFINIIPASGSQSEGSDVFSIGNRGRASNFIKAQNQNSRDNIYGELDTVNSVRRKSNKEYTGGQLFIRSRPNAIKVNRSPLLSGPLIHEVLSANYINIYNKSTRLLINRYMRSRHIKGKNLVPKMISEMASLEKKISSFTHRRRVKTRRKYHRKTRPGQGRKVYPLRHKFYENFGQESDGQERQERDLRISKRKVKVKRYEIRRRPSKKDQAILQSQKRRKKGSRRKRRRLQNIKDSKLKINKKVRRRFKRLTRRFLEITIKPSPRCPPRAGGFLWPGDYLRLAPGESSTFSVSVSATDKKSNFGSLDKDKKLKKRKKKGVKRKVGRKKRPTLRKLYVQPRRYLLENHNIKVIKRKLEKAQRSHKIKERVNELKRRF